MRLIGRLILTAVFVFLTAALVAAAAYFPGFFYLYTPLSQKVLSFLAGVFEPFPFAVWEPLLALIVLIAVYTLIRCFVKKRGFLCWAAGICCTVSMFVLAFVALWGLNHWAPPIAQQVNLNVEQYSSQELYDTTVYMAQQANLLSEQVPRTADGDLRTDFHAMAETAGKAFASLADRYPFFARTSTAPVKKLTADKAFSYMGLTGIFIAYTGEACVNPDTYAASLPFTMCHEAAHRATVAPEEEANFCAFLACIASEDPAFRYSGWYSAFIHCYNALFRTDREAAAEVRALLTEAVELDLQRANRHYAQYDGAVKETTEKVNDAYLKAFNEEDGVRSYGRVTDLLIAWYLSRNAL